MSLLPRAVHGEFGNRLREQHLGTRFNIGLRTLDRRIQPLYRQRIGIARLALRRYDLIIADEITASLDPDTSGQVMENLLALPCMVVAITHDVSGAFMKQFDKVYRVEHGSVTQA